MVPEAWRGLKETLDLKAIEATSERDQWDLQAPKRDRRVLRDSPALDGLDSPADAEFKGSRVLRVKQAEPDHQVLKECVKTVLTKGRPRFPPAKAPDFLIFTLSNIY